MKPLLLMLLILPVIYQTKKIEYPESKLSGTLIIAAIGKDGIMIAADSRTSFGPDPSKPLAYFDSAQKIVRVQRWGVGIVGLESTNNVDLAEKIIQFGSTISPKINTEAFILEFHRYLLNSISRADILAFRQTMLIFVGYDSAQPKIIATEINQAGTGYDSNIEVDSFASEIGAIQYFKYNRNLSCYSLGKLAEKAIYGFADKTKETFKIGGPISILQIKPGRPSHWMQNNFTGYCVTMKDFIRKYQAKTIKLTYLQPNAKQTIDSIMRVDYHTK